MTLSKRARYTQTFRDQVLQKVYSRGNLTVNEMAEELNLKFWALKN